MGNRPATDWEARFQASREPQVKVLDKSFAGIPAGARMLDVTPRIVDAEVSEIPPGAVMAAATLRQLQAGADPVTPFWRAVDPESDLAGKLARGRDFLRRMRSAEAAPLRTSR